MALETHRIKNTLHINMGPQHPSTHGVLRVELELDGEVVVSCKPIIGYLHTGIEKTFESMGYLQGLTLTDRMDYLNPMGNNLAYCLSDREAVRVRDPGARRRRAGAARRADADQLASGVHRDRRP